MRLGIPRLTIQMLLRHAHKKRLHTAVAACMIIGNFFGLLKDRSSALWPARAVKRRSKAASPTVPQRTSSASLLQTPAAPLRQQQEGPVLKQVEP